jgi:hypothetical protein
MVSTEGPGERRGARGRGTLPRFRAEGKGARDEAPGPGPERGSEDGSEAQAGEHVAEGARGQGSNRSWPGEEAQAERGRGAGGERWRPGSETTSMTRMRPAAEHVAAAASTRFAAPCSRAPGMASKNFLNCRAGRPIVGVAAISCTQPIEGQSGFVSLHSTADVQRSAALMTSHIADSSEPQV